jgi:hypothetical protein
MPWNETAPMNERVKFIARYLQKEEPFSELCEQALGDTSGSRIHFHR